MGYNRQKDDTLPFLCRNEKEINRLKNRDFTLQKSKFKYD